MNEHRPVMNRRARTGRLSRRWQDPRCVPSYESALRTFQTLLRCHLRDGLPHGRARRALDLQAETEIHSLTDGIFNVGGTPTKTSSRTRSPSCSTNTEPMWRLSPASSSPGRRRSTTRLRGSGRRLHGIGSPKVRFVRSRETSAASCHLRAAAVAPRGREPRWRIVRHTCRGHGVPTDFVRRLTTDRGPAGRMTFPVPSDSG